MSAMILGWVLWATLSAAQASERRVVRRHVFSVMMQSEYGTTGRRRVVRWATSPQLYIDGGAEHHREMARQTAQQLSALLTDAAGLAIEEVDEPGRANLRLYFAPLDALPDIAAREGFHYVPGNQGLFWVFWDNRHQIDRAIILIAEDWVQNDEQMTHLLLEEMTQSLGLMNDSPLFPESIFYETSVAFGTATRLAALDERLILLLYGHIPPNASACAVRRAFRRHWPRQRREEETNTRH